MYVWKYFFNEICPLQFWNSNYVTGSGYSSGYHDLGGVRWQLALCYLLAFICVILALSKSIKTSGKVRWQLAHARDVTNVYTNVYFRALLSYSHFSNVYLLHFLFVLNEKLTGKFKQKFRNQYADVKNF